MNVANAPGKILDRVSDNMEAMAKFPTKFLQDTRARFQDALKKRDFNGMAMAIPQTEYDTVVGAGKGAGAVSMPGLTYRLLKKDDPAAIMGDMVTFFATAPEGEGGGSLSKLRESVKPREIPIAGEKVPVLVGEAEPTSRAGRLQTEFKRAGVGEQSFKDFFAKQQAKVKQVIRNVAQQTSGMTGPMADEPGAAMHNAADATFERARPMYKALDDALVTVPDSMENVSAVTKQAIARANKLGVEVTEGAGDSVVINGRKFSPESDPVAWKNLQDQGLVPNQSGQPLSTYMKVRSELLKMRRGTSDGALRYAIANEVETMNKNMESAMKDTPLWDTFNQANRLWSKGFALQDIAEGIRSVTEGTPASAQAPGMAKIPTEIKGPQLVSRLNDLAHEGILDKGLTREEISHMRQAADILDRASVTPGREFGFAYSLRSTIMRNVLKLPPLGIVKAMTTVDGVEALRAIDSAKTPAQMRSAATKFAKAAGSSLAIDGSDTAGNHLRSAQGKPPGQQIRDLNAIRSNNPNLPVGVDE